MTDEEIRAEIARSVQRTLVWQADITGRHEELLAQIERDAAGIAEILLNDIRSSGLTIVQDWSTDMEKAPKNKSIWILFKNALSKTRTVKAVYATKDKMPSDGEFGEYSEEHDEYFAPPGWYEDVYADTGLDYSFFPIFDVKPIAWAPLLPPPSKGGEHD